MRFAVEWNRCSFPETPISALVVSEIGRPLLDKGVHPLALVGPGECGAEARNLGGQPRCRTAGEGECHQALGRADRGRAVPGNISRYCSRRRQELVVWMNRVDQTDAMRLRG